MAQGVTEPMKKVQIKDLPLARTATDASSFLIYDNNSTKQINVGDLKTVMLDKNNQDLKNEIKLDIDKKLNKNLGMQFQGQYLKVDSRGEIVTAPAPSGGGSGGITVETDPTVPAWAKADRKPSYKTSELENDSNFVTEASLSSYATKVELNGKVDLNQGSSNSGKILGISPTGAVVPIEKPSAGGGTGGTNDYLDLINKPKINGHELSNNLTTAQLGIKDGADGHTPVKGVDYFTASEIQEIETAASQKVQVTVPTKLSQLTNDKNFVTKTSADQTYAKIGDIHNGTTNYAELTNKPQINGHELTGNISSTTLGITNGKDGKTPQKGVDYYTTAEKQQFVQDVIAALPKWNGGAY